MITFTKTFYRQELILNPIYPNSEVFIITATCLYLSIGCIIGWLQ